ncbi:MAG: MerR family transcriptional regulator [Planctomycetota bacterium]|jgi:predicted site-specific integrase-resolvase
MFSTIEAANCIGVSKNTLLRWLDEGLVDDVERDWRGWRVWMQQDIERIKAFKLEYHSKPIKRRRRSSISRAQYAKAAAQSMASFARGYLPRPEVGV